MDRTLPISRPLLGPHLRAATLGLVCLVLPGASRAEEEAQEEGEEVMVVQAEAAPVSPATGASVTVLPVDETVAATEDVASVVETAAGTTVQRLGGLGDWSGVSIRGAGVRHTLVCLDGVPLNPDGAASVNLSELPLSAFERIEIHRGAAPPELGGAAMGGVVNLVTGRQGAGVHGEVAGGSHGTGRLSTSLRTPGELGPLATDTLVLAEAFTTRGDYRYFSDNGTEYNLLDDRVEARDNNDKTQLTAHGRWEVAGDRWRLQLLDAFLDREEGLPGHAAQPTTSVRLQTRRNLGVVRLSGERGTVSGQARAWSLLRREVFDDRLGEIGTGSQWQVDRTTATGGLLHGRWAVVPALVPGLTLSARRDGFQRQAMEGSRPERPLARTSLSGALSADAFLLRERVVLSPALHLGVLRNPGADALLMPSPRVGLLLRPTDGLSLRASGGFGWRPPDFTELYGDRGAVIGNPDLSPERGLQLDAGLRLALPERSWLPAGSVELGVFRNRLRDQIVLVQNSQRTMVPVNLDQGLIQGLEAAAALDFWGWVATRTNLTRTRSEDLGTDPAFAGNQLPRVPAWELSQRTSLTPTGGLRIGHLYSYTDGNYWDRTNYYRSAPRSLHGLFARVEPGGRYAPSVELAVHNLLDTTVEVVPRNPLDPDADELVVQPITDFVGHPLAGRTLMLALRWEPPLAPRDRGETP